MPPEAYRTRFAPSPTGLLHLGHAFSALTAQGRATGAGGSILLRIEDIDAPRCKPEFDAAIFEDLRWLGLDWPEPVLRQSARLAQYRAALDALIAQDLCYPCRCTRRDIRAAQSAPHGPAPAYPGTCRGRPMAEAGAGDALRLDMGRALDAAGTGLGFSESGPERAGWHPLDSTAMGRDLGDVVLARRDIGTSYHIAVIVDDAAQGITEVVRGMDLFDQTPLHRLLQALLGLPTPVWHHHRLIRDDDGQRLAKRDDARAIRHYRDDGLSPRDLRARLGLTSPGP